MEPYTINGKVNSIQWLMVPKSILEGALIKVSPAFASSNTLSNSSLSASTTIHTDNQDSNSKPEQAVILLR